VIFDRGDIGSGASGASAGMVSPVWHVDRRNIPLFELGLRSLSLFPIVAQELANEGVDPEFRPGGVLKVATTPHELKTLLDDLSWQEQLGLHIRAFSRDEVREREPLISPRVLGGVFSPTEGQVNARRFVDGLAHSSMRRGVEVRANTEVLGLTQATKGGAVGVHTPSATYLARHVVVTAGHWTRLFDGWGYRFPVVPVKGQRILLRRVGFVPSSVVYSFNGTTVPQRDGSIIVGATREKGRADTNPTLSSLQRVMRQALRLWPVLREAIFVEARVGVRPGSVDDIPILGPLPNWPSVSIATGHDWAGTMLSLGTGEIMAQYITSGDPTPLADFSISRFV